MIKLKRYTLNHNLDFTIAHIRTSKDCLENEEFPFRCPTYYFIYNLIVSSNPDTFREKPLECCKASIGSVGKIYMLCDENILHHIKCPYNEKSFSHITSASSFSLLCNALRQDYLCVDVKML